MPPASWTTPEQYDFLYEWLPKYMEHTENKGYQRFWPVLTAAWFAKWPEAKVCFPDTQGALTSAQETIVGKAVEARKNVGRDHYGGS